MEIKRLNLYEVKLREYVPTEHKIVASCIEKAVEIARDSFPTKRLEAVTLLEEAIHVQVGD